MSLMCSATDSDVTYKRIRVYIQYIYKNSENALELERLSSRITGVKYCKANPITGRLLIVYDDEITDERLMKREIYKFVSQKINSNMIKDIQIENSSTNQKNVKAQNIEKTKNQKRPISIPNDNISYGSAYHSIKICDIEKKLNTDFITGLSKTQVDKKLNQFGLNVISEGKRKSIIAMFLKNLNVFSTKLLVGAGVVSFMLGQFADAAAILSITAIETILSTVQQYKAEKSLYSLKEMIVKNATVIRNGKQQIIDAKCLVPGDIIIVEAGQKVPADARLIECYELKTSESTLTGESTPVCKDLEVCDNNTELANRYNIIYMGTNILYGRGKAVVIHTGINTEIGKIAYMLQNINNQSAPIEKKIRKFTNKITKISFALCIGISALGFFRGASLAQVFILGISFAMGAIPESLPAVVTAIMAFSVQKMTAKNAIVRKLPAVETLGSANIICCDKTGTLTMNEMTVKEIYVDNNLYEVTGSGYNPKGDIILKSGERDKKECLDKIMTAGILCNNSNISKCDGKWQIHGDPTEAALLTVAYKNNTNVEAIINKHERIKEIPFDSSTRYMTVLVDNKEEVKSYCKGSLSKVLDKCTRIYENGEERLITFAEKENLHYKAEEMGRKALRVLAFAYKRVHKDNISIDNNFVFLGLVGMEDPPREGVQDCIKRCINAGVKVVMITGDNKTTASAIGRKIGLLNDGMILCGNELEEMSDDDLTAIINKIEIFARTSPEQKYKIVKAFKRAGNVVAMTGDGVNDAPAIKEADIGIAMGGNGSDVARDTADIILTDDNFATIVAAIEEGRNVNLKIKSCVRYLLSGSLSEVLSILLACIITKMPLLLSLQVLWINAVAETILGSSLTLEKPSKNMMNYLPISKEKSLVDRELKKKIIRRGVVTGVSTFGIFQCSLMMGYGLKKARTLAFTNLILSQIVNVYDCKANKKCPNRYMNAASVVCLIMQGGILYFSTIRSFFKTTPLNILDLLLLSGTTTLSKI